MNDSYISYGSDGSYHIIRQIGEGFDIETAFLIALVILLYTSCGIIHQRKFGIK